MSAHVLERDGVGHTPGDVRSSLHDGAGSPRRAVLAESTRNLATRLVLEVFARVRLDDRHDARDVLHAKDAS